MLACTRAVETYCPLEEGRTWVYQFSGTVEEPGNLEPFGRGSMTNLAPGELRGRKMMVRKWELAFKSPTAGMFETMLTFVGEDGECIYMFGRQARIDAEPEIFTRPYCLIKRPVRVGTAWEIEGYGRSVIESIDDVVRVPAGTFKGCVRIKTTPTADGHTGIRREDQTWYAPGIGWVKSMLKEWNGKAGSVTAATYTLLQLESFKRNGDGRGDSG
jgi:hypothetical protein